MADEFEVVCGDALVKFFDADRGHVHESLLFFMRPSCSAAKAIADDDFREKWQAAFAAGEPACEGLGQVHLLSHGIWAYKVNAAGERTDLVYQEPVADYANDYRYADGLVLTEWKKAAVRRDAASKFEEARNQARSYAQGALAGNELGGRDMHNSGASRRGNANLCLMNTNARQTFSCHHPRRRVIQYSEASAMESRSRGVRDTPHASV
jgi:hypothetical protein